MADKFFVLVVSVSILKDNKVLMIKEKKPSAYNKWNFPSGQIEYMEDILVAACREVKEETGYEVRHTGITGIYNFIISTNNQVILFHFTGDIVGGALSLQENEIIGTRWIKLEELMDLDCNKLRNGRVIKQIAKCLLKQEIHTLDIFSEQVL